MLLYQIINILDASNPSRKLIKDSDSIFADAEIFVLPGRIILLYIQKDNPNFSP